MENTQYDMQLFIITVVVNEGLEDMIESKPLLIRHMKMANGLSTVRNGHIAK